VSTVYLRADIAAGLLAVHRAARLDRLSPEQRETATDILSAIAHCFQIDPGDVLPAPDNPRLTPPR
jgi:hypothetical protein